jgi:2-polyprenyl-6-methoxyphenol hydroxylase-like FAD-dependent oxidoreductase
MFDPTSLDPPAIVLGGGIAGLAAARLLARHHAQVVVFERDLREDGSADDAFRAWDRSGVPQFLHSHAFLARLRLALLAHFPDVLERLRAIGVREIRLAEMVPPGMVLPAREDDEDVVLLACRRATFEWALRESVRAVPNIELREGVLVAGLVGRPLDGKRPTVTGVRLEDGSVLAASVVVDALGRRSPAAAWLAAIGAPMPREKSSDSGIFYFTRFYHGRPERLPGASGGLVAADLGWVKLAIFPGDHDTFSITVGTPVEDEELRRVAEPRRFERFLAALPSVAPWRAPGVSHPLDGPATPVRVMGQLRNRLRHFVDRDGPLAPGFFAIGDSAYHSNPIYGRGCPMALMAATFLDEALALHPRDPIAAARHLHRVSEQELRPWWEAAVVSDRRMQRETATAPANARAALAVLAEQAFGRLLELGVLPATRVDPVVFRALLRTFHMLDAPERLLTDPAVVLRSLPTLARTLAGREPADRFVRVTRDEALRSLARGAPAA